MLHVTSVHMQRIKFVLKKITKCADKIGVSSNGLSFM